MISKGVIKCNHYAFAALLPALADEKGANIFPREFFRYVLSDPVSDTLLSDFNLDRITGGNTSKLLLIASAAGHVIKLSFLSLSVF